MGAQPLSSDGNDSEHALRSYWRHMGGLYFRRTDEALLERLDNLEATIQPTGSIPFDRIPRPLEHLNLTVVGLPQAISC